MITRIPIRVLSNSFSAHSRVKPHSRAWPVMQCEAIPGDAHKGRFSSIDALSAASSA
jgi:hypothetical protein